MLYLWRAQNFATEEGHLLSLSNLFRLIFDSHAKWRTFTFFFTFLFQLSPGFQILHKFRFIISIHSMNKESVSLKHKNQKTSTNPSSSATTSINYGMNWLQESLIYEHSAGHVGHSKFDAYGRHPENKISATLSKKERVSCCQWLILTYATSSNSISKFIIVFYSY